MTETTLPITKLSYSSMMLLLRNPLIFKLQEILGVYSSKSGVSAMIGRACHKALRAYYGGDPDLSMPVDINEARAIAKEIGLQYLNEYNDAYINYGKEGSREDMLKGYIQTMNIYFAEEPEYHKILLCEEKMEAELKTFAGEQLPLPAVGIPDLVHEREDGGIEIVDTKFVTSFTDYETEDYVKIVQSQFMFHLLLAAKGIRAERMLFREVKRTLNTRDNAGKPQIRDYAIPFDHKPYFVIFYNLYKDVVRYLSSDPVFLPNLADRMDGEHAGLMYAQGLISADMSDVEVMHKVRDVAYTTKKFVASRLDSELNKHLLPDERVKIRLAEFGIPIEPVETITGATVTEYRFRVSAGVRMATIKKHKDDIARALQTKGEITILAPIPGTDLVGVQVENEERGSIGFDNKLLQMMTLNMPLGVDVQGNAIHLDLSQAPHLLIAGATGAGKSVLLRVIITALTAQIVPEELRLLLIDPKRVELSGYATLPHVDTIAYEYEDSVRMLLGLVDEMELRYRLLEKAGKRDIGEYNAKRKNKMPYIVLVIDEFADLMIRSKLHGSKGALSYDSKTKGWLYRECLKRNLIPKEWHIRDYQKIDLMDILEQADEKDELKRVDADVELLLVRLAAMARAVGIHLVIATQSPRVDVITGLIKANFPTRIALTTASAIDSGIILGQAGAENLSGKGDMLLSTPAVRGIIRLQGYHL